MASKLKQEFEAAVSVDRLLPHPRNPRQGDIGAIFSSIETNGFYGAVIAQKSTGFVLVGNHRFLAAREAGMEDIPVFWVDVDDDRALRILLVDNRSNDLASYDDNALLALLQELPDLDGTGYTAEDMQSLLELLTEEEKPRSAAADESQKIKSQYQVLVDAKSEKAQAELLERLMAEGWECRALIS